MREEIGKPWIKKIKPYLPGKPIEEVRRELNLRRIIKLASNENPLGPSPRAVKAIRKWAKKVWLYPEGGGYWLKEALSRKLGVRMENLILGNGSDEIVSFLTRAFLKEGEEIVMGDPSFIMYSIDARIEGGKVRFVPLKDFRLDLPGMLEAITPRTRLVFISNPNNPTGTIVKKEEVEKFLEKVPPHILVVFDEAYYEYVEDASFPQLIPLLREKENLIILRTFSKIYGLAGLRIGYGVAREEIIDTLNRVRPPFNVNSLAQKAALASLEDERQVERSRKLVREGKKYLYREFERMGLFYVPTQANFILVRVGEDASQVERELLKRGVIVRGMGGYGLSEFIRVTIGRPRENKLFIRFLREIKRVGEKTHN